MPDVTGVSALLWLVTALCLVRRWQAAADWHRHAVPDPVRERIFAVLAVIRQFRRGLDAENAARLRTLLDVPAVVIVDAEGTLGWNGEVAHEHIEQAPALVARALATGVAKPVSQAISCGDRSCPARYAMIVPLKVDDEIRAALVVYSAEKSADRNEVLRAVAGLISDQLSIGEWERSEAPGYEAPLFPLPSPIPAMFVSQSLAAVGALTKTDPEGAADLLREFADFLRYRSRQYGEFAELAEEVRCVDQYLVLARIQLGDRLTAVMDIDPEVLPFKVPFLCLQPLVELAVQHAPGPRLTIVVADSAADVVLSVEHEDPRLAYHNVPRFDAERPWWETRRIGGYLGVSDLPALRRRLGRLYGDDYALEVDVRAEVSTKVTVRLPKS
ncbi:histidine kinase [Amycolatopsis sp. FBCC-B4732]|uniref:sensor histidine kinase n=1 Tax=Amycolatopsis sp. FBCC-B4732 TaxID=3079339 RepID=UPI001FF30CFC|nr:histidine kinase [Amycolatopsis sp. FBCC-B4732]UOX86964.1 histidine kinase [Amycolatopsis sp. FBCC-B4732]